LKFLNGTRGYTSHYHRRSDITPHNGIRSEHRSIADIGGAEDHNVVPDPDVVPDHDRTTAPKLAMCRSLRRAALCASAIKAVVVVRNINVTPHQDVISHHDPLDAANVNAVGEADTVAQDKAGFEALIAVAHYCLEPEIAGGIDSRTKLDKLRPSNQAAGAEVEPRGIE
jgi:hypothetical protein